MYLGNDRWRQPHRKKEKSKLARKEIGKDVTRFGGPEARLRSINARSTELPVTETQC